MNAMIEKQDDARIMESVLLDGDLSKLSPAQRVSYYLSVCDSLGLNPKTKPFKYITLNGKLTLYAQKDATDQLRKLHGVSIDDVDIKETDSQFIVKVKGHDETGRSDVEVGVVNKTDMRGDTANAQMKAVTKSKRRLTLSICGLGFLDETEVVTIPDARAVEVTEAGEIKGPEWNIENQETGQEEAPIELIDPMGEWAIGYASEQWNSTKAQAAIEIGAQKLGKRIDKREFIKIIAGERPAQS
jgi:hypothetical protein